MTKEQAEALQEIIEAMRGIELMILFVVWALLGILLVLLLKRFR